MSVLPSGWIKAQLGEVADWGSGGTPKADIADHYGGSIPWAVIGDLNDGLVGATARTITDAGLSNSSAKLVDNHTVLVAMYGSIGKLGLPTLPMATNQAIAFARPKRDLLNRLYLFYYLMHARDALATAGKGATQQNISQTILKAWPIPVAPRPEQERIVAVIEEQFSRLDAGVAVMGRIRQNLKRMRAAVLNAAVAGQLVPQDPKEGFGADVLARIDVGPRRLKRKGTEIISHTPAVPPTWATAPWAAIGRSQNGRAFPSADYTTKGRRLLRPGNLHSSGDVVWSATNTRCLPERYAAEFPDYLVGEGEIVMNLTAQSLRDEFLGRVCMTGQGEAALLNQRIARLIPVGMNPRFVFLVLKSPLFRNFVSKLNTGSLIQHMFTWQVDQFVFPIPPRHEQDRIVTRVEEAFAMFDALERLARHAHARVHRLRSAVLEAAFSGKLVPQDFSDEPASVLLERVATERPSSGGQKPARVRRQRRAKAIR